MDVLLYTLIKRPYVFLFLAAFLYLGIRHQGLVRTLIWMAFGYIIAFASEYSSIHNGFPYGEYHYIYENLRGELLLAGVPVWDSISYAFMTYAGYTTAIYVWPKGKAWQHWVIGGFLTMLLDVITDPVAKLGKDWFLGEIYYYAHEGIYFGIPWTNFAGWFLVALAIIGANLLMKKQNFYWRINLLFPAFYISICLFSTVIAFFIKAYALGVTNLIITVNIACVITTIRVHNHLNKKTT